MEDRIMQNALEPLWYDIYDYIKRGNISTQKGYYELMAECYSFSPAGDCIISRNTTLFDIRKAAAMYFWYKKGDPLDKSILKYFDEYKHCVDAKHNYFNSNYGVYAFSNGYLDLCVKRLIENENTRQAMFCINNNTAMGDNSIDKLCTNTIQFVLHKNILDIYELGAIIQMRSSNFLTLLPYDVFMFSIFYAYVYNKLIREKKFKYLSIGRFHMQVASLHFYEKNLENIKESDEIDLDILRNMGEKYFFEELEDKLRTYLK